MSVEINGAACDGDTVVVHFKNDRKYRFHTQWLRDSCRDETFVRNEAGERLLERTLVVEGIPPGGFVATAASVAECGLLEVTINEEICTFDPEMLGAYASRVAELVDAGSGGHYNKEGDKLAWLRPFDGVPGSPAPNAIDLWTAKGGPEIPIISFEEAMTPAGNLKVLRHVMGGTGAIRIRETPKGGVDTLHQVADFCFGGLQKDPSREESNWIIVKKLTAASVSYNPSTRLNNHSDQSLPNHGIPGLVLLLHYAKSWGANTFVDGFAAAEELRKSDPEAFHLLSHYGNDQERDLLASRQDADQGHTGSLCLTSAAPMIQLDEEGGVKRIQYNEVFRTPSTVPFDKFKAWYSAYLKFAGMLDSEVFEREVPMVEGDFMILNNWRCLHGRAGARDGTDNGKISPERRLCGGTVTRENAYSRARQLLREVEGVKLHGPRGLVPF